MKKNVLLILALIISGIFTVNANQEPKKEKKAEKKELKEIKKEKKEEKKPDPARN